MTTTGGYGLLGRSGLRVSPLALGTMTFGQADWGCERDVSHALMDRYIEWGGNFVDTADLYGHGASEEIVGEYVADRRLRDQVVIATKFSLGASQDNPNSGGNGRKAMMSALESSLRRLRTDYVDLYYMHAWDGLTPVDEVMAGLQDLVTQGKVRYVALSDVPAWYAARAQTLAEWRGRLPVCAVQLEYSLVERGVELEFPTMCAELGMAIVAWSPLGMGVLSGKYTRDGDRPDGARLQVTAAYTPPELAKLTERNLEIADVVREVAAEVGRSPAQVATAWLLARPAVGAVLLGARTVAQLDDSLGAADAPLPADAMERLNAVSELPVLKPYSWFGWGRSIMNPGVTPRAAALTG
jgi:aryl-alcohol dehydrogenase-like predicted oxidoreductase